MNTTLPPLVPLERNTLWDSAYVSLRTALMEGRLAPGQRIVLRDVAERLGISLTPVRDAVNRLIAEHVLERGGVGQGGGATVPLLSADQFRQLMAVRASLEPGATVAAAPCSSASGPGRATSRVEARRVVLAARDAGDLRRLGARLALQIECTLAR